MGDRGATSEGKCVLQRVPNHITSALNLGFYKAMLESLKGKSADSSTVDL